MRRYYTVGGQEGGLRSTTENLAGIVGFVKAAEICHSEMESEFSKLTSFRDRFSDFLLSSYESAYITGDNIRRLPGHISFCLGGLEGEDYPVTIFTGPNGIRSLSRLCLLVKSIQ